MTQRASTITAEIKGKEIDVAILETIDLARLAAQEPTEVKKLLEASQYPGFFYLDLRNDASFKEALIDLPSVYDCSETYFNQSHALKMRDYRENQEPG